MEIMGGRKVENAGESRVKGGVSVDRFREDAEPINTSDGFVRGEEFGADRISGREHLEGGNCVGI